MRNTLFVTNSFSRFIEVDMYWPVPVEIPQLVIAIKLEACMLPPPPPPPPQTCAKSWPNFVVCTFALCTSSFGQIIDYSCLSNFSRTVAEDVGAADDP